MHDSIDMETKRKRLATLNKTWNDLALEKNKVYIGRTVTVLSGMVLVRKMKMCIQDIQIRKN